MALMRFQTAGAWVLGAVGVAAGALTWIGALCLDDMIVVAAVLLLAIAAVLLVLQPLALAVLGGPAGRWYLQTGAVPSLVKTANIAAWVAFGVAVLGLLLLAAKGALSAGGVHSALSAWAAAAAASLWLCVSVAQAFARMSVDLAVDMTAKATTPHKINYVRQADIIAALEQHERNKAAESAYSKGGIDGPDA